MTLLGICVKEIGYSSEVFKQTPCCPDLITMGIFVAAVFLFSVMFGLMLGAFFFKLYTAMKIKSYERIEAEYVEKPEQTISYEPDYKYYEK